MTLLTATSGVVFAAKMRILDVGIIGRFRGKIQIQESDANGSAGNNKNNDSQSNGIEASGSGRIRMPRFRTQICNRPWLMRLMPMALANFGIQFGCWGILPVCFSNYVFHTNEFLFVVTNMTLTTEMLIGFDLLY